MKYITTDKHPELKEGLIMFYTAYDDLWQVDPSNLYSCTTDQKDGLLKDGYIKEVEEKEFTGSDVIDAINFSCRRPDLILASEQVFGEWKNQR